MISVEQLIGDLLLRHNCVIVPAFGGFVAGQTSAMIDFASGVMMPPKKSLMFNRQLVNNDGLLVNEFAQSNNLNFADAQSIVTDSVNNWTERLRKGERVAFDRVGHLYFDTERNICFEQDRFFNLLLESYGLGKVQFITEQEVRSAIHISEKENIQEETLIKSIDFDHAVESAVTDEKIIVHPAARKPVKIWRYVAAACMLPLAFYSFWIPMRTDVLESGLISIKDFNPFYTSAEGSYKPMERIFDPLENKTETLAEMIEKLPEDVTVISYPFDDDLFIPVRIKSASIDQTETTSIETEVEVKTVHTANSFHYIVGCFGSSVNANNLVNKLKLNGLNAIIAGETNGLTRVSAGSAVSADDLQAVINKASALGYTGWVFKK